VVYSGYKYISNIDGISKFEEPLSEGELTLARFLIIICRLLEITQEIKKLGKFFELEYKGSKCSLNFRMHILI
jgi:hypothetical protein